MPTAWLTSALVIGGELLRDSGWHAGGDLCDVLRLAAYWLWCRVAWQASANVDFAPWTPLAKTALAAGLVATVLT